MTSSERDGMGIVDWIKLYRARTGASLKVAKDAHDRGDEMPTAQSYPCRIVEADFEQNTVTVLIDGPFTVRAGPYRLTEV